MKVLMLTALFAGILAAVASYQYRLASTLHYLNKNGKKNLTSYYIFVFLTVAILASVAGLRYGVGSDFGAYYWGYPRWEMEFSQRWQEWDEPGLSTLAKILYPISKDGAFFIFVTAALTISLFGFTIAKNTDSFFFCIMLYIFTSCWNGCFNGVRQYLAAAILFAGHKLMFERKFLKFCILMFIASSIHVTALIMLPMYFLITQVLDLKKIAFIMVSGIAMIFSYDILFDLLGFMKDSDNVGTENYAQSEVHPLRILIALAPIILYFFLLVQRKGFTGRENFYMGFVFVRAAVIFGTSNSAYLNRAGIYFAPFIPIALGLLINKFPKNQHFILKAIILILYLVVWYYIDVSKIKWYWVFERIVPFYNKYA